MTAPVLSDRPAAAAPVTPARSWAARLRSSGTLLGLAVIVLVFSIAAPDTFLTPTNGRNILEQVATLMVVAGVQTVVMVVGDFDLSVGATASLSAVVAGQLLLDQQGVALAVAAALACGALVGAVNGALVAYVGLSSFVATLASMTSIAGTAYLISGGSNLFGFSGSFLRLGQGRLVGVPIVVLVAVAVAGLVWLALGHTPLGRRWYAVGGNPQAAELSGVNVAAVRVMAFVVVGLGAAVAGLMLASRLDSAQATIGDPVLLPSIAAVFLGMTMFRDGSPRLLGTVVGVAILGVLTNGLNILGVSSYAQQTVTGLIIILAVAVPSFLARRARR